MELRNIKTFVQVVESDSFSAAAEVLSYAQSTVTAHIASLESELGILLFHRLGKKVVLSADGKVFLNYCYRLLKDEAEVYAHFHAVDSNRPSGTLKVGMLESISFSIGETLTKTFIKSYPDVKLNITIATTIQLMKMLENGMLDCIITLDNRIMKDNWHTAFEKNELISFFTSNKHPLISTQPLKLKALIGYPFMLTERGCNYRHEFEQELSKRGLTIYDQLEIGHTLTLINIVSETESVSLLPAFTLESRVKKGDITLLALTDFEISMYTQVIYNANKWLSPSLKVFIDLCRQIL